METTPLLERITDQVAANEAPVDKHAKVDQLAASTVLLREVVEVTERFQQELAEARALYGH